MIGFIGLGDIGLPMATRLLDTGHDLMVWNRTPDKAAPLLDRDATLANSPQALFENCDLIGLCLTSHEAVEQVAAALLPRTSENRRRVVVDLSTGAAEATVCRAREAAARNVGWVDAPVSGGSAGAAAGTLTLFVGGEASDIETATPLLAALGARHTVMGGPGSGQAAKICNQMIVACSVLLIGETIAMARKAGIDVGRLPAALQGGFADSLPLQIFGSRMAAHSFEPRLGAIALMCKDLDLALGMSETNGARTPLAHFCSELYGEARDPNADISALINLFEG